MPSASFEEFMRSTPGGSGEHLRLCVRVHDLSMPAAPSEVKACMICGADVWYDPKASLYPPGELIVCTRCMESALEGRTDA